MTNENVLTLELVRHIDLFRDRCHEKAKPEIKRERQAYYLFGAIDETPDNWPVDEAGDGCCDYYCHPCALRALKIGRAKGSVPMGRFNDEYDGPRADHCGEGESSRNCYFCGRPLPWALLTYGMESEVEHYTSKFFRERAVREGIDLNNWYWLWRVLDECSECETYMIEHGPLLLPTWAWLQHNGFFDAKPGTPLAEKTTIAQAKRILL